MQIDYNSPELNSDTHMLQVLMKDLFERKPEVRYDQLCNQLSDQIMTKVFDECHKQNLIQKNTRVVVDFKEPAGDFNLNFSLEPIILKLTNVSAYEEFGNVIRGCVKGLIRMLRKEHNLDDVELGDIKVFEYHDIAKGF